MLSTSFSYLIQQFNIQQIYVTNEQQRYSNPIEYNMILGFHQQFNNK